MSQPDQARIDAALAELQELADTGRLSKAEFRRLWKDVEVAQGDGLDEVDALEAFFPHAKAEDWIPAGYR